MAIDDYGQWIRNGFSVSSAKPSLSSSEAFASTRVAEVSGPERSTVPIVWRFIQPDTFQDFFDDFEDVAFHKAFPFTVPQESAAQKYRFSSLSITPDGPTVWSVNATLERFNGV